MTLTEEAAEARRQSGRSSSHVGLLRLDLPQEFLHIFRDRGTLIAAFSIPVFQMLLFGFIHDPACRRSVICRQSSSIKIAARHLVS